VRHGIARDHQAAQFALPVPLDRFRHARGCLAGADHDRASARRRRQVLRDQLGGVDGGEGRLEQMAQELAGIERFQTVLLGWDGTILT